MAYTVKITYAGVTQPDEQHIAQIMRCFVTNDSYADTAAYAGTVYDTNVDGWGELPIPEPYASTSFPLPVPFAQFKMAMVAADGVVEFPVDDYKEAFYYLQVGQQMADQGFSVEVTDDGGTAPENQSAPPTDPDA